MLQAVDTGPDRGPDPAGGVRVGGDLQAQPVCLAYQLAQLRLVELQVERVAARASWCRR